ncbi:hypothetical protein [Mycobacteroides chelonae]|uniref:hypothetical protein n=1 Tax=Mycobacteroides chelonae TaxID=1774 RepID=UPI0012FF9D81|nr:hypothetical protein [Mycobacteroides chelonae]
MSLDEIKHVVVDNDVVRNTLNVVGLATAPFGGLAIPIFLEGYHHFSPSKPETNPEAPKLDSLTAKRSELGDIPSAGLSLQNTVKVKTFADALARMDGAQKTLASRPQIIDGWDKIGDRINSAMNDIQSVLNNAEHKPDFKGKTKDAIIANFRNSLVEPQTMGRIAKFMSVLAQEFENTVKYAADNILDQKDKYELAQKPPTNEGDLQAWDQLGQNVMQNFGKNLATIGNNNPNFNYVNPSNVRTPQPATPGANTPGSGGGKSTGAGSGKPTTPSPATKKPTTTTPTPTIKTQNPSAFDPSSLASQLANTASDAGKSATDAAKSALSGLSDAANSLGELGKNVNQSGLPEGVLGLGPSKVGSTASKLGGGAKAGGGAGSPSTRSAPRTAAASPTAVKTTPSGAASSRAGVGTSGSSAGGGAPAAGQRGAGSDKEHKVSKALRNRKQGEDLIGDVEAVVSVLGDSPKPPPNST